MKENGSENAEKRRREEREQRKMSERERREGGENGKDKIGKRGRVTERSLPTNETCKHTGVVECVDTHSDSMQTLPLSLSLSLSRVTFAPRKRFQSIWFVLNIFTLPWLFLMW